MDSIADNSCFLVPVVVGALVALDQRLTAFSESDFHRQILLLELKIFLTFFSKNHNSDFGAFSETFQKMGKL